MTRKPEKTGTRRKAACLVSDDFVIRSDGKGGLVVTCSSMTMSGRVLPQVQR